ncbi:MAG: hypothetical protein B6I35_05525 [Anaerolineaceae bacterium 4572_32.2]|nr:MAG: hypothetical protein B6I35_05525 [Anaerolineaceae bacterium 4572_32.2]
MFSVFIPVMVMVLACTCLPSGNEADTPPPPPPGAIFQDDFGDEGSGWEVGDYDTGSVGYKNGVYFVTSEELEMVMWGVANRSFDNIVVEVDATQISAGETDDNAYGVVCREQGNGDGYYLRVSGDGYYSIAKAEGEEFEALVEWAESDVIRQGDATNHIRAICDGSTLTLFVNGQRLATAEDSTFASGDIALTATTYEEDPSEVHFDDLVVNKPR